MLWNEATIFVFETNVLDLLGAEGADQRNEICDLEVLYLGAIVKRENGVSLSEETQKDNTTGPDVDLGGLVAGVEE